MLVTCILPLLLPAMHLPPFGTYALLRTVDRATSTIVFTLAAFAYYALKQAAQVDHFVSALVYS